jgi:hypothetical protein
VQDAQDHLLTTTSAIAAAQFCDAMASYIAYRADAAEHLRQALVTDPDFALAHCLRGYFAMLCFNRAIVPAAQRSADAARRVIADATRREAAHLAALDAWITGAFGRTLAIWGEILAAHPRDVLALTLADALDFTFGRPHAMLDRIDRVRGAWSSNVPGYGALLACRAFALEECGHYGLAELVGREAIARDPANLWATHAVAHVLEMQGRRHEGITFLDALATGWDGANNLRHHLWWHAALFHIEQGDFATSLALYDHGFRDLAAPLTEAMPDIYIDIENAASTLQRLELRGVDVGARWEEIADKAEARIGDCLPPFTQPHWMMALAAAGRDGAAARMLAALRDQPRVPPVAAVCEGVWLHRRGDHAGAIAAMRPALPALQTLGGSHAQRDVLEQIFLDAALRTGSTDDVRLALERATAHSALPLHRRIGYAEAAAAYPL